MEEVMIGWIIASAFLVSLGSAAIFVNRYDPRKPIVEKQKDPLTDEPYRIRDPDSIAIQVNESNEEIQEGEAEVMSI